MLVGTPLQVLGDDWWCETGSLWTGPVEGCFSVPTSSRKRLLRKGLKNPIITTTKEIKLFEHKSVPSSWDPSDRMPRRPPARTVFCSYSPVQAPSLYFQQVLRQRQWLGNKGPDASSTDPSSFASPQRPFRVWRLAGMGLWFGLSCLRFGQLLSYLNKHCESRVQMSEWIEQHLPKASQVCTEIDAPKFCDQY